MSKILVTGGAGYIGSFMTKRLLDEKYDVVVLDSLERGHAESVDSRATFKKGNLLDKTFLTSVFSSEKIDAVIHFAGYISMGESMQQPSLYFTNNTHATVQLLDEMVKQRVNNIIFSSTAGVYGNPKQLPIPEDHAKHPENPYGESKLMVEQILAWYQKIFHLNFVVLRYFNASGAALDGSMGEKHSPETHIIPSVVNAVLQNKPFTLYGNDYATKDGTCVRDYIHVLDLVEAHILALKKLESTSGGHIYNVGTGKGFSNTEVINMVEKISGKQVSIHQNPRRPGDADSLIADATRITSELQFNPQHSDLQTIVESAWKWHTKS